MQVILNLKTLLHQDHIFGVNYLVVTLREDACWATDARGCRWKCCAPLVCTSDVDFFRIQLSLVNFVQLLYYEMVIDRVSFQFDERQLCLLVLKIKPRTLVVWIKHSNSKPRPQHTFFFHKWKLVIIKLIESCILFYTAVVSLYSVYLFLPYFFFKDNKN